jgi:hypothetical protein
VKFRPPTPAPWRRLLILAAATAVLGSEIFSVNPYQIPIDVRSALALWRTGPVPGRRTSLDIGFDPPFARGVEQVRRLTPSDARILLFGPWPHGQGDPHYYAYAAYVLSPRGVSFCDGPCRPPVELVEPKGPLFAVAIRSGLPAGWRVFWQNRYLALGRRR